MRRRGERGVGRRGVAVLHLRRDVAGRRRPDQRRARGGRLRQFRHHRQFVILDHDGLERVLRLFGGLGDQRDHRSPTKRTISCARPGRSGVAPGEPSGRVNIGASGSGFTPAATRSAPVKTASTPGIAAAAVTSIETIRACACGDRRKAQIGLPGQGKIVGEAAGAGQQPRILDPPHFAAAAETPDRRSVCHCFSFGSCPAGGLRPGGTYGVAKSAANVKTVCIQPGIHTTVGPADGGDRNESRLGWGRRGGSPVVVAGQYRLGRSLGIRRGDLIPCADRPRGLLSGGVGQIVPQRIYGLQARMTLDG